ncbi:MAG: alanine racemase [Ignavibacteria bacterium]|jgi:alanine racemase|nr:alanine racemase [Ignavibacteria bacterium]MCU7504048.1 alanine racemase [Ignavibacteria bacterium]MCU7515420.1 alanine racemase [Ignavibacteria bacterium]
MRPTIAKINRSNLKYNFLNIRKRVKKTKVMAIVKADAYGHGMVECVKTLLSLDDKKPDYYAVALLEEAVEFRKAQFRSPVLVFAPPLKEEVPEFIKHKLLPTVFTEEHLENFRSFAKDKKVRIHIKIDTGMGRLGVNFKDAVDFIKKVSLDKQFIIDGIYTHFATSDEADKSFALKQLERFKAVVDQLKAEKINYGLAHAANSGAILDMPEAYFDMVRPGIILYGYYPSSETSESIKLKPVMSIVSSIASIREVEAGQSVSYGRKFIAGKKTRIASAPIGYADGYQRGLSNRVDVIIKGKKYPQVGQVCMDRIMFDIGLNANIKENDEVILLGKSKGSEISAADWAKVLNTIPYEITCNISKRVPRIYTE